jgi:hypothetical protein
MRKVLAGNIHPGDKQFLKDGFVLAGWPDRGYNFRFSIHNPIICQRAADPPPL